ncbi:IclR family transcriptional regulator [Actinacidiphila sp. ITFR-21]|uniref:IclR family transcriptional regulator n=1 Tax=Actinacidiphila sp. ITFR-21 TaxID=3075199 RepID=UPI00288BECF8|nr:IclR family transcriptional regulator [Streptomyces sp. ITFR-21]WNI18046.1 IclR family transcriptional regulator [Streptomyces sp. ITFR-21]
MSSQQGTNGAQEAQRTGTQAVERALALLRAFETDADKGLTVTEVAARVGLTVPTTRRILHALEAGGALDRNTSGDRYQLGLGMAVLGGIAMRRSGFAAALPELEELGERTGEAVNLGVLSGGESVTVVHLPSRHPLRIESYPGARNPAHVCAMGKALMAYRGVNGLDLDRLTRYTDTTLVEPDVLLRDLMRTHERGYSVSDEERVRGVRAVGVPILLDTDHAVAAIAVQGPSVRMSDERMAEYAQLALSAARRIAEGPFGRAHAATGYSSLGTL